MSLPNTFIAITLSFISVTGSMAGADDIDLTIIDPFKDLDGAPGNSNSPDEKLNFKNTQEWGENHLAAADKDPTDLPNWVDKISLSNFPANTSERTKAELDYLVELQKLRTPEIQAQIDREVSSDELIIGDFRMGDLPESHPELNQLLYFVYWEMAPILMQYKYRFNRVRPSFLRPEIKKSIEIPTHAAYPSGHATVCHLYALVIADILPDRKAEFIQSAIRVAKNREIAGVHYPSDSSIGKDLAEQIYTLLQDSSKYHEHLEKAKVEMNERKE